MPELPEVEVTARALRQAILGCRLVAWRFSGKSLRHPFPRSAVAQLEGEVVQSVSRRAKYVLIEFPKGWLVAHLGMSGSMACGPLMANLTRSPHDHVGLQFQNATGALVLLNYHDPRRFGSFQWCAKNRVGERDIGLVLGTSAQGIEPFDQAFDGGFLVRAARGHRAAVKPWLMQGQAVVGVGNIYACEALFDAGIHPARRANAISAARYERLAAAIRRILGQAIAQGGSSISDFLGPDGQAGRYGAAHQVYDREGRPCVRCTRPITRIVQAQRSTFFCRACQR